MPFEEEAFMMDSASEDSSQGGEQEESFDNVDTGPDTDNQLMEYLLKGYALTSSPCVKCETPLIKSMVKAEPEKTGWFGGGPKPLACGVAVTGVPFCVSCKCVVVTCQDELKIMWEAVHKHLMGIDGAVDLQLKDGSPDTAYMESQVEKSDPESFDAAPISYEETGEGLLVMPSTVQSSSVSASSSREEVEEPSDVEEMNQMPSETTPEENEKEVPVKVEAAEDEAQEVEVQLEEEVDFNIISYDKRRQIATKVLGAKMVQGYTLKDAQCERCSMPFMENPSGKLECVVCPVFEKKVRKKMAEKRMTKEKRKAEEKMVQEEKLKMEEQLKMEQEEELLQEEKRRLEQSIHIEEHDLRRRDAYVRKQSLREQLYSEKKMIAELRGQSPSSDFDEEERRMEEELRLAKELRLKQEERRRTEAMAMEQVGERKKLIEELRLAKLEQKAESKRRAAEEMQAKERFKEEKLKEFERESERKRLVEELRQAKIDRAEEQSRRKEEASLAARRQEDDKRLVEEKERLVAEKERRMMEREEEHQRSLKAKEEDYKKNLTDLEEEREEMMQHFKQIQINQKNQASRRQKELEMMESRAKESERQLSSWKEMADNERTTAEEMRIEAEEKLVDAEEALIEAEELALEAQKARDSDVGDRQRLIAMYRKAEELRTSAEADETAARQQHAEAERRLENSDRMRRVTERKLEKDMKQARRQLEESKTRNNQEAMHGRERLREAENQMLEARFGDDLDVAHAGDDWESRRLLGKKILAKEVMSGWSVLPEYCIGRMCNYTPLIGKGDDVKCVVCEGSGNGCDGAYDEFNTGNIADTMSFVARRNKFSNVPTNRMNHGAHNSRRSAVSREVGRRILDGWILLEAPCESCQMPLMSEAFGTQEFCIQCNGDVDFEEDEGYDQNTRDDVSISSRQSITLEIPEGFDPSDPNAMAGLIAQATSGMSRAGGASRGRGPARNRIPSSIGGGGMQRSTSRGRVPRPHSMRSVRSQSPSPRLNPESRNAIPAGSGRIPRQRSMSRTRTASRRQKPQRPPQPSPMYISTAEFDDDEASQLSDDVSVARSVASHTMDAIMNKINDCKAKLNEPIDDDDDASVAQRSEAADLIQKLAAAANAVRELEASAE
eukprot:CAMPEP_0194083328 /NCGR_PEP_ID=MMETSP0149-20130528/8975_1 /TAXON_ID=122233 /ORGANISM="Chaetoceros debilis, Strain MM31A-1" /LENGTH=1125 /DNA_ID=CAMNT_0038765709 /DNA_START=137 /DNA_END=3514 /DNA_ORIENTATION=+